MKHLIQVPCDIEHFSIPNTVKTIHFKAFDRSKIIELIIPATVTELNEYTCYLCPNLTTLFIHTRYLTQEKTFSGTFKEIYYFSNYPITNNVIEFSSDTNCKFITCQDYFGNQLSGVTITQKIGECSNYIQMTCFHQTRIRSIGFYILFFIFIK